MEAARKKEEEEHRKQEELDKKFEVSCHLYDVYVS